MADGTAQGRPARSGDDARRYSAFISYSHADVAFARKLHRQLETYRLPHRALVQASGAAMAGARLKPVFRDTDELSASHDLTEAVREALASSEHLIVVCSPDGGASPWVAREIELFRALHGETGIVTALAAGDPDTAFPAALRRSDGHEPLAADFRGDGADRRLALLKLVAVLAGVRLDALIQRDAQRRMRGMAIAAAGTVASVAVVAGLSLAAFEARRDAADQRARAGSLGNFMLSDLRKGLEAAGRHDLLAQVDQATLKSLNADISRMTPDQLIERAKALQAAGEDAEKKGDLKAAHAEFDAALTTTTALLAKKPDDPKRIFAHAQSEYWEGFISLREGDLSAAQAAWEQYAHLADRLVRADPGRDEWRMENVYAAEDLGILALRAAGDASKAEAYFQSALAHLEAVASHRPADDGLLNDRSTALAWLGDSQRLQGRLREALVTRETQRRLLQSMLDRNARSVEVKRQLLANQLATARIVADEGGAVRAISMFKAGGDKARSLAADDPDNKDFRKQARMFDLFEVRLWIDLPRRNRPSAAKISEVLGDCAPLGPGADNLEISDFCHVLLARFRSQEGDAAAADEALAPVRRHQAQRHDVLTARWGLDLAAEARPVQLAERGKQ